MILFPEGNRSDESLVALKFILVLPASLYQLPKLLLVDGDALVAHTFELVVFDFEGVAGLLYPGVIDVLVGSFGVQLNEQILQVVKLVSSRHLVEDVDLAEVVGHSVVDGESEALDRVVDIDKRPGLVPHAIDGHGVPAGHLRAEPVEHSAEVAVDVDAVAQVGVHVGFRGADSPDDALVQLGYLELEVFLEVEQSDVIQALGHVVNAAGVVGVHDLHGHALAFLGVGAVDLGHAEALRDLQALHCAVPVHAHGADVDQVALLIIFHHGQ